MIKVLVVFLVILFSSNGLVAQQTFIKSMEVNDYGAAIRILATPDLGWVIYSSDSLKLTKFNSCGMSEWSKKYNIPSTHASLTDFISLNNGGFAILTRIQIGTVYNSLITKLDANGNIIWSKAFGDVSYHHFSYSLMQDNQGNLVIYGNVSHINNSPTYSMLTKLDASGNISWTRFYNYGYIWGGAIVTSDNGCLFRHGNTLIKTDSNGNVQWTTQCLTGSYYYLAPIEVSDGYIYTGYLNSGTQYISFFKIDKQGNLMWGGRRVSDFIGTPLPLHKKNNGNIVGVFSRVIVEFDKDLNILHRKSISIPSLYGKDICFPDANTAVLAGNNGTQPFFAKMDAEYNTDCSVALPIANYNLETIVSSLVTTNMINYNFNTTNLNYSLDTFSVSLTRLCSNKQLDLGSDTAFCENETIVLKNQTTDLFHHYLWSTGDTTASITTNEPGTYWLSVSDDCGENSYFDTISITTKKIIASLLGADKLLCENGSVMLYTPDCDTCLFTWNTGSNEDSLFINSEGTYWLNVKNNNGCESTDTINVDFVKCECDLYVPNAFTPNDDGLNDSFQPYYYCDVVDYSMQIFNRWGQLIFFTDKIEDDWKGRLNNVSAPTGIYIYRIKFTPIIKGEVQKLVEKSGTLSVIY